MKRKGLLCLGICLMAVLISACAQELDIIEDTTPPAAITELKAVSDTGKITLSWVNPADADFYGAKIYTGVEENGTVNYDKGIILNRDEQEYTVTGLKDDGIYTFRASAVDACFNESSYVTSEQVVFKEKIVEKKNNKFVCPECKKEYDKDEDAAKCHGATTLYSVKITAGTYKVYHMLQTLDFINYHLVSAEDNKKLEENSTIDNVKKDFAGFTAKSITYNKSEVYVYYNRKPITYTFSSGSQGGFINENTTGTLFGRFGTSNTRTSSGYYGTIVPAIDKPKAEGYGFSKWDSNIPETFGSENKTFTAEWTSIASCVGSGIGNGTVYSASDYVMLSKDSVKTSMGKAEIYPFLMTKTEVTYNKWKEVINWAKTNGYINKKADGTDLSMAGAAGSYEITYKDCYTGTEYPGNSNEEQTYPDGNFYDQVSKQPVSKTVTLNLITGKRYFVENNQNIYFERGDSLVIFKDSDPSIGNKVKEKDSSTYISVSNLKSVDINNYVLLEKEGGAEPEKLYLSKEKYINPVPFTGDEYVQPNDPEYMGNEYSCYFAEYGNNNYINRLVKSNISTTYSGTDIIFEDSNGKYVRIQNGGVDGEKLYLDSTLPYIFVKPGLSNKYVINKADNNVVEIEYNGFDYTTLEIVPDVVCLEENTNKIYLLDGSTKVYGTKLQNPSHYTFTTSYGTVYFTPWKSIKIIHVVGGDNSIDLADRTDYAKYGNDPVTRINWLMAAMWCNAASEMEGLKPVYYKPGTTDFTDTSKVIRDSSFTDDGTKCTSAIANAVINPAANGYRLPTEAEWEYAARGGDQNSNAWNYTYAGSNNINEVAWYYENANTKTHEGRNKAPNTAGLYDMSGNVFEFCWNTPLIRDKNGYYWTYVRGGSWTDPENYNHVDSRHRQQATAIGDNSSKDSDHIYGYAQYNVGFRVVRSVIQ